MIAFDVSRLSEAGRSVNAGQASGGRRRDAYKQDFGRFSGTVERGALIFS